MLTSTSSPPASRRPSSHAALRDLPPFPQIASKLIQVLRDENIQTSKLVDLVRSDPTLASELLHAANSGKYSMRKEISSLQHAVTILGRDTLRSFAVAVSLRTYLGQTVNHAVLARVWRHSVATAIIAELLSEASRGLPFSSKDDSAYVAGLLHDVGSLGLMVAHPKEYTNVLILATDEHRDLREVERTLFEIDHCDAGRLLSQSWNFSPLIEEVAATHHDPVNQADFKLVDLIRVAVMLADCIGHAVVPIDPPVTFEQIRDLLPEGTRKKFLYRAQELTDLVGERIQGLVGK